MCKKKMFFPVVFFLLSVLLACSTDIDAEREIPEYSEALLNKIESLFEKGQPAEVLQLCRSINDSRVETAEVRAVNALKDQFEAELSNEDYFAAAESLKSLTAADIKTDYSLSEIYLKEVMKELKNNEVSPALAVLQNRIININAQIQLGIDDAKTLMDAAVQNRNRVVMSYLMKSYPEYSLGNQEDIQKLLDYRPGTEELISGTVTIWVNRGIKIERGVGYPDRIIGSGFYIDPRGYILTNYHVISSEVDTEYEGFSRLYIKYDENEDKIPASVVGWDESLDIALLKVEYDPEYFYNFSALKDFKPGEKIYAIGSPGGLDKTITSGIISASGNRRLLPLGDTIQVDVPINSGNSGGPVVDTGGNLVGVVFAGIEQFEGVNFIIPVKWILNSIPELYRTGRNRQSWLGLTIHESNKGLEVIYVLPTVTASTAGLEPGDEIVSIDGKPVLKIADAQELIQSKRPGTLLKLKIIRNGEALDFLLKVEPREDSPMEKALKLDSRHKLMAPFLGMAVEKGEEKIIGQQYIIKEVYRGMAADETGLSVNDPFTIVSWQVDDENGLLIVGIRIKKKKAGFLETVIQLGSYIDIKNTI